MTQDWTLNVSIESPVSETTSKEQLDLHGEVRKLVNLEDYYTDLFLKLSTHPIESAKDVVDMIDTFMLISTPVEAKIPPIKNIALDIKKANHYSSTKLLEDDYI
jgi:hypothetical protein